MMKSLLNLAEMTPLIVLVSGILGGSLLFTLGVYTSSAVASHDESLRAHPYALEAIRTQITILTTKMDERDKQNQINIELILEALTK